VPTLTPTPYPTYTPFPTFTPLPVPKKEIDLAVSSSEESTEKILTFLAAYIIQHGYGNYTAKVHGPERMRQMPDLVPHLQAGDIDILISGHPDNRLDEVWQAAIDSGTITALDDALDGFWWSNFVVPTYVVDQHPALKTVYDIPSFRHIFRGDYSGTYAGTCSTNDLAKVNPDAAKLCAETAAIMWTCLYGWECENELSSQLDHYGLKEYVFRTNPGTSEGHMLSLKRAVESGEPWLGWMGTSFLMSEILAGIEVTKLEEPPAKNCNNPSEGCAYPLMAAGRMGVNNKFLSDSPEIVDFLQNMHINHDILIQLGANYYKNLEFFRQQDLRWGQQVQRTGHVTAIWFLKNYEEVWVDWVPVGVSDKIKNRVAQLSEETGMPLP